MEAETPQGEPLSGRVMRIGRVVGHLIMLGALALPLFRMESCQLNVKMIDHVESQVDARGIDLMRGQGYEFRIKVATIVNVKCDGAACPYREKFGCPASPEAPVEHLVADFANAPVQTVKPGGPYLVTIWASALLSAAGVIYCLRGRRRHAADVLIHGMIGFLITLASVLALGLTMIALKAPHLEVWFVDAGWTVMLLGAGIAGLLGLGEFLRGFAVGTAEVMRSPSWPTPRP